MNLRGYNKKSICIIKLGAVGDVLRTTPILRALQDFEITWITSDESYPILEGNPMIDNLILVSNVSKLSRLDTVYNFDEDEKACRLAEKLLAKTKKGYGWKNGEFYPFNKDAEYAYRLSHDDTLKFELNKKTYQQIVFEMAGLIWREEDYVLGYKPTSKVVHPVGINYMVGRKFPNKLWLHWEELKRMIPSASMQKMFNNIKDYIDWINSCEVVVTSDSLGMHIALALKKKVIALMGCTSSAEIEMYGRGIKLSAGLECSPCYKKEKCNIFPSCMDLIAVEKVYSKIQELFKT